MLRRHVGRRLGGELIQFMGRHAVVDALDDLLGQDVRLDVLAVEAVAQFFDAARDLVVSYNFLLAVALDDVDVVVVLGDAGLVPRQVRGPAVGGFVGILSRGVGAMMCWVVCFWRAAGTAAAPGPRRARRGGRPAPAQSF